MDESTAASEPRRLLQCHACQRIIGCPPEALGRLVRCPHCNTAYEVRMQGTGDWSLQAPRWYLRIPKGLFIPIYSHVILGLAGLIVGVFLILQFLTVPDADYRYAYGRVIEFRSGANARQSIQPTDEAWEHSSAAAAVGAALAIHGAPVLEDARDQALARAWQPAIWPTTLISLALSTLTLLSGISMLLGRGYWLAFLGCVAAIIHVNYLCCLPGVVSGVWGLLMLVRDDARQFYGLRANQLSKVAKTANESTSAQNHH